jgi:DNA-directed RNA polymerase specialized sigma24 family protein
MEASAPPRPDSAELDYEALRDELRRALSRTRLGRFAGEASLSDEDVVQEAIARLIAEVEEKGRPPGDAERWLFRTATNLIKDRIKLDAIHPTAPHEPASAVFEGGGGEAGLEELVEARLSQAEYAHIRDGLDREEAALVVLREAGLTVRGAAEVLGKPKSSCQERLKAALEKIAGELDSRRGKPAEHRVRSLATAIVAGTLSASERTAAAREMQYNLALRAEVSSLRHGMHEVATLIPLEEALAQQATGHSLMERAVAVVDKAREIAYSFGSSAQGNESAAGGMLAGTGQKVAALCATGAAAATCVGAGVVGPGVSGVDIVKGNQDRPAREETVPSDTVAAPTTPAAPTAATPGESPAEPVASEPVASEPVKPAQRVNEELGIEPTSTASAPGSSSSSSEFGGPSGGGGGSGGGGSGEGGFSFEK